MPDDKFAELTDQIDFDSDKFEIWLDEFDTYCVFLAGEDRCLRTFLSKEAAINYCERNS